MTLSTNLSNSNQFLLNLSNKIAVDPGLATSVGDKLVANPTTKTEIVSDIAGRADFKTAIANLLTTDTTYKDRIKGDPGNLGNATAVKTALENRTVWCADGSVTCKVPTGKTFETITATEDIKAKNFTATGDISAKNFTATEDITANKFWATNLNASNAVYTDNICNKNNTGCFKINADGSASFKNVYASNPDQASYTQVSVGSGVLFKNGDTREGDGGKKTFTIRNDDGSLRLMATGGRVRVPKTVTVIKSLQAGVDEGAGELDSYWDKPGLNIRNDDGRWTHFNDKNVNYIRGETKFDNPVQIGSWRIEEDDQGYLVFKKWKDGKWSVAAPNSPYVAIGTDGNIWSGRSIDGVGYGWITNNMKWLYDNSVLKNREVNLVNKNWGRLKSFQDRGVGVREEDVDNWSTWKVTW